MSLDDIKNTIEEYVSGLDVPDKNIALNAVRKIIHDISGIPHPVGCVQFVPIDEVQANDYNPNAVAPFR